MTERFITYYSFEEKTVNLNMLYKAGTFLSVILAAFIVSCSPYPLPPETRVDDVIEEMHGISIPDPYHWLEDRKTLETQNWIDKQNRYAEEIVGETPYRNYVEERFRELMDIQVTPLPKEAGSYEYFSMRRLGEDLPIIYRRKLPEDEDEEITIETIHKSKISKLIKLGEIQDAKTIAILMMAECVL